MNERVICLLAGSMVVAACYPATTRPSFLPEPTASINELQLAVPQATRAVALALDGDSIPVRRTEPRDGWLETAWFDANTLKPTARRPLGPDVVRLRAFVDPSRPNYSNVTVEVVYRPFADPSLSDRELEREVPATHPVAIRVVKIVGGLVRVYGGAAAPDSVASRPDSLRKKP
jgi:hypothetical protein